MPSFTWQMWTAMVESVVLSLRKKFRAAALPQTTLAKVLYNSIPFSHCCLTIHMDQNKSTGLKGILIVRYQLIEVYDCILRTLVFHITIYIAKHCRFANALFGSACCSQTHALFFTLYVQKPLCQKGVHLDR